jgi:tetratricopeptide (TPR) repeat protein
MYQKAIALDPKYAFAYMLFGWNYYLGWAYLLSPDPNGRERAFQMAQLAIALDDSLSGAHALLADIYVHEGQADQAATEAQRSIALDPNSAVAYAVLAAVMNNTAKPAEALIAVETAIRLDPLNVGHYLSEQGRAYSQLGRYEEAIPVLKRDLARSDILWDHV